MRLLSKRALILAVCFLAAVPCVFYTAKYKWFKTAVGHRPRLFGAVYMTMNNPFFHVLNNSISDVIESNGDILITRDSAKDQDKQNSQIQELIDEGIVALFLNPADWVDVKPALEMCRAANVAVFNIDAQVFDADYVVSIIESDNYLAGVLCARDMLSKKTSAKILMLSSPELESTSQRINGFLDTLMPYSGYEIVGMKDCFGEIEVAHQVVGEAIESGYDFDVVFGGNDPSALGALAALRQYRRNEGVLIYGVDGSPDFMTMLEAGYVEATSVQSPKQIGAIAAETAYKYLSGEEIPKHISVPVWLLTKHNLDKIDIFDWQ